MSKKHPYNLYQALQKINSSGLADNPPINRLPNDWNELTSIQERADKILGIVNSNKRLVGNMLFFVMYDIESNKVRYQIVKYLLRKGCMRIQRSIFLADLPNSSYEEIKKDLTEVQSLYDNHDSLLVVPISTDYLRSMKIIGKSVDIDVITHSKNTLFF